VKFVCDGCGKKYATAEDPSPGKVYKLKCKACGHLIVVKAMAGTSTAIPALSPAELASVAATPLSTGPELEIEIEPEPQAAPTPPPAQRAVTPPPIPAPVLTPAPLPPEVANAIDGAAPVPSGQPGPSGAADQLPPPPPPEKDELADFAAAAAEVMAAPSPAPAAPKSGYVDLFGDGITGEHKQEDPFAKAARGSLPDGHPGASPAAPRADPPKAAAPKAAPPKPASKGGAKSGSPLLFIALGAVLLGGITAVAVFTGGKKEAPRPAPVAAAPAPVTAPIPAPPPPPEEAKPPPKEEPAARPAPPPAPKPVVAEKRPEPKPEPKPRPPERKPEPKAEPKPEPRPEPKPEPRVAAAPPPAPEARTETRDVQLQDAETALTPEVVQKVINANRKAFASCISAAGPDVKMDGRKVALKLTVNANGAVTYPTLDDVTLNPTEMGQCLKSAARLMIFPKFKGDPFHVEVPLTLSN
jgi:DNA-directed RNA polymerase subunit RPC12/RpoP